VTPDDGRHDVIEIATSALPSSGPAAIAIRCYSEGLYLDGDGQPSRVARSGGIDVIVFSFADGTRTAIGVYCNAGGCGVTKPMTQRPDGYIVHYPTGAASLAP
jgi:hypothetical protein